MVQVVVLLSNCAFHTAKVEHERDYTRILGGNKTLLRPKGSSVRCYVNDQSQVKRLADNPWCTFLKSNFIGRSIVSVRGPVIVCGSDAKDRDCDIHELVLDKVKSYHAQYFDGLEDVSTSSSGGNPDDHSDDYSDGETYRCRKGDSSDEDDDDDDDDSDIVAESDHESSGSEPHQKQCFTRMTTIRIMRCMRSQSRVSKTPTSIIHY